LEVLVLYFFDFGLLEVLVLYFFDFGFFAFGLGASTMHGQRLFVN
jgi:hypothetical protein